MLTVAPSGKTKLITSSSSPFVAAQDIVTGSVAAEDDVPNAMAIAGRSLL